MNYHDNNMIMVKGTLEIDIDNSAKISGIRLQANEVLIRAKDLVLESLQDTIQERMRGMQLGIGANKSGTFKEFGGKAELGKRDAAWTRAIGSIIGTQVTHIVVQQTLEIAGGLIANAEINSDGSLTDKGNAHIEAGSIIAKKLHDYDNGKSFGLGATLTKKADSSGKLAWGVGMPVTCAFNEQSRDILPVIGRGTINGDAGADLSRNLGSHIGATTGDKASLHATVPVSDIVEFIQAQLLPQPLPPAPAAGDEPPQKEEEGKENTAKEAELQQIIDKFTKQNPEYAKEIEHLGYRELKRQLSIIAKAEKQKEAAQRDLGFNQKVGSAISEFFVPSAEAAPMAMRAGIAAAPYVSSAANAVYAAIAATGTSVLIWLNVGDQTNEARFDIHPEAGKGLTITTPAHKSISADTSTPDQSAELAKLSKLPGFTPADSSLLKGITEGLELHELTLDELVFFKKQYPDTVDKINERYPINADLAGKKFPLPEDLQALYPEGVVFKPSGYPNFSPYILEDELGRVYHVELDNLTGLRKNDDREANKAMGVKNLPKGFSWHHVEDGRTMIAVPEDLHEYINASLG